MPLLFYDCNRQTKNKLDDEHKQICLGSLSDEI